MKKLLSLAVLGLLVSANTLVAAEEEVPALVVVQPEEEPAAPAEVAAEPVASQPEQSEEAA